MSLDWSAKEEPVYSKLENPQTLNLYSLDRIRERV